MSTEELDAVTQSSSNDQDDIPEAYQELVRKQTERVDFHTLPEKFHALPEKLGANVQKLPSPKDASAPQSSAPMQPPQQTNTETTMTSFQLSCEETAAGIRWMNWGIDPHHPWNVGNIYQKCLSKIYGEGHPMGRIDMQPCFDEKGKKIDLSPLSDATMGLDRLQTPPYFGFGTPPPNVVFMPLWPVTESAVWMRTMVARQEGAYILRYDERDAGFSPLKRRKVLLLNNPRDVCFEAIAKWEKAAMLIQEKNNGAMALYRPIKSTIRPLGYGFGCEFETTWQKGHKRTIHDHGEKFSKAMEEAREHEAAAAAAAATAAKQAAKDAEKDAEKAATEAFFDNLEEREAVAEAEEAKEAKEAKKKKDKAKPQRGGNYSFTQPADGASKTIDERPGMEEEMKNQPHLYDWKR
jgi:hypothetical protein